MVSCGAGSIPGARTRQARRGLKITPMSLGILVSSISIVGLIGLDIHSLVCYRCGGLGVA